MPSIVACPSCQKQLKVPDELIGKSVKCPGCKETFTAELPSRPAPVQQEIPDQPRKKTAPPPEEEYEGEAPRRPARRGADDEEEERPARRRASAGLQPHRGVMIVVLGALSLVCCGLLGIPAWLMGNTDVKAMDDGTMDPQGRQLTQIGKILGMIGIALMVLQVIGGCFVGILKGIAAGN